MLLSLGSFKVSHNGMCIAAEINRIVDQSQLKGKVEHIVTGIKKAGDVFRRFRFSINDKGVEIEDNEGNVETLDENSGYR